MNVPDVVQMARTMMTTIDQDGPLSQSHQSMPEELVVGEEPRRVVDPDQPGERMERPVAVVEPLPFAGAERRQDRVDRTVPLEQEQEDEPDGDRARQRRACRTQSGRSPSLEALSG